MNERADDSAGWIGDKLAVPRSYGEVQSGLVRFFQSRRRLEAVAEAAARVNTHTLTASIPAAAAE